jgi:hypothetical protein
MPQFTTNHIIIEGRTEVLPYTSTVSGRSKVIPRTGINRLQHGTELRNQFNVAVDNFSPLEDNQFVYLVFRSPWDCYLDLEKLDKSHCRLASYKLIETIQDGQKHSIYEATVFLNRRAISTFLRKIEEFINNNTPLRYNPDGTVKSGGNPLNQSLIANIEEIRAATLESFWQEPEIPFPNPNEVIWWEIWLAREDQEQADNPIDHIRLSLEQAGIQISQRYLKFPEHYVYLMRANALQLGSSLLYSDRLAEIRKPRETADFFTYLDHQEQNNWLQDLADRTDHLIEQSTVSVCLLDTGINITNPLLINLVPPRHLDAVEPGWTRADTHAHGHGTPMAGIALYGDLSDALASAERIQIYHHLESVKLLERNHQHDPLVYGAVTQEAISRGEAINPNFKRMICMAITSEAFDHKGRPSSWSSAIDQSIFGSIVEPNENMLFFVSSGNLPLEQRKFYPLSNNDFSIQDPAQSFNAITVGAYTLKDLINLEQFPASELLASRGSMSPCNTTSTNWGSDWSRKPDIVLEGGNQGLQNEDTIDPDSLQLLSTSKGGVGRPWLTTFSDTSAATALASKFAAELYYSYPNLLPETIRALIIHSADWTPSMLQNRPISELSLLEKEKLFSLVGYGVPNMQKARYSANNSLSLIIERIIKPYKYEDSRIKTDEFHLVDLPWPVQALQDLFDTTVKFKITLSYFIEPNPGNKQYEKSASYRSHGLRFKMIDSNESLASFKRRVSKGMREEGEQHENEGGEHWILGERIRNKGSIHKDIWYGTAADLATRNKIAVYPVGGWWKAIKKHNRYECSVRYSLVMTIDTPSENTDIYSPVMAAIGIPIPIEIDDLL